MTKNLDEDLKNLSISVYNNGKGKIPSNWQKIATQENPKTGFYGEVYKRNNEIVIVYRGTDTNKYNLPEIKDFLIGDTPMGFGLKSGQYNDAKKLYNNVNQKYGNKRIVLTGHSLGGSLAQIVSAETGRKAVTFNAYGTGDILLNMGYKNQRLLDITNYGNKNDNIFQKKLNRQPGTTYITNSDLNIGKTAQFGDKEFHMINFESHKLENMDALSDAIRIVEGKGQKSESPILLKGSVVYDDYSQKDETIFDENKNYNDYVNEVTKSNKIFTKEDIENMSKDDLKKNQKAIDYQKKSIGIPTKKQAASSGMVYVTGYTRSDGTEVQSYYRARPA